MVTIIHLKDIFIFFQFILLIQNKIDIVLPKQYEFTFIDSILEKVNKK